MAPRGSGRGLLSDREQWSRGSREYVLLPATTLLLLLHLARGQGGNSKRGAAGSRVVGAAGSR